MMYALFFIAFWLACGAVAAGWECAVHAEHHSIVTAWDAAFFWFWFGGGAISAIVSLAHFSFRHGWRKWW